MKVILQATEEPHLDHHFALSYGRATQAVVQKYLLGPYGMNETSCDGGNPNPQIAVCLNHHGGRLPEVPARPAHSQVRTVVHPPSLYVRRQNCGAGSFLPAARVRCIYGLPAKLILAAAMEVR